MFDLILRGGKLVRDSGVERGDLALREGRVAAILRPGEEAGALAEMRCDDRILIPGLVDAHAHMREPGLTHKEDFATGTRAALLGGVTTVLVMPTDDPWTSDVDRFCEKRSLAKRKCVCDFGLQAAVPADLSGLEVMADEGAISFEIFTSDVPPAYLHATAWEVEAAVRAVAACGRVSCVSALEHSIRTAAAARTRGGSVADYVASYPDFGEAIGIGRNVLAAAATGAAVHIRQISSGLGIDVFRRLRAIGDVTIETSPQCLYFHADDYERLGPNAKASPPFRTRSDVEELRAALADGTLDIIATDHAPHSRSEKNANYARFADIPGGMPGVQTLLPAMLGLVQDGVIDLLSLVRVCCTAPAERFGLGRKKGSLRPGCDADIVIIDPGRRTVIRDEDQASKAGYSVFSGMEVDFAIDAILLRGRLVWTRADGVAPIVGEFVSPVRDETGTVSSLASMGQANARNEAVHG